jgi:hypothetical protein
MKIHALTTGAVRVKHSFLFPSCGAERPVRADGGDSRARAPGRDARSRPAL